MKVVVVVVGIVFLIVVVALVIAVLWNMPDLEMYDKIDEMEKKHKL